MKKFLTNNTLKILSLVISFIIWIYVVTVISPDAETTIRAVPITYSGHQSLIENGYMITQQSTSPSTVDLKLSGPRNLIARLSKENITAYIDFTGYSSVGTYSLPVKVRLPFEEVSVADRDPYNITVSIERVYTHTFEVEIVTKGTPKDGYLLDQYSTSTGVYVDVEGPVEIVKTIEKAIVEVDVGGAKDEINISKEIQLLNSNGDVIDKTSLTLTPDTADVTIGLLKTKSVPITVDMTDEGYNAEIIGEANVTIIGKPAEVDAVSAIMTESVQTESVTGEATVKVRIILPEGIRTEQESHMVTVKITEK